jgi:Protein of unknown function (DUF4242)
VAKFLLEIYLPRSGSGAVLDDAERAAVGAERVRRDGASVRYLRSITVLEDETCFLVYEAESVEDVRRAASLAGLPADHIVEAVETEA